MAEVNKLDQIARQLDAGVPVWDALRLALGVRSFGEWAARQPHLNRTFVSDVVSCRRMPSPGLVEALAADLGCTAAEAIDLLRRGWQQRLDQLRLKLSA
jgi:hypothetical protein